MALNEILETIRSESEETVSSVVASAHVEAEETLDRARAVAAGEKRRLSRAFDDRARQERSRILSRAHLEAAQERRAAREQIYLEALEGARQRLGEVRSSPEYEAVLGKLLDEAVAVLPNAGVVAVDPADVELMQHILDARDLDLEIATRQAPLGGVTVRTERRGVDNMVATRLQRADEHLRYIAGELIPALRGSEL
ncbi:MAG: V-type ATP synthase subunit E [Acidimicrobiia bacterium]